MLRPKKICVNSAVEIEYITFNIYLNDVEIMLNEFQFYVNIVEF